MGPATAAAYAALAAAQDAFDAVAQDYRLATAAYRRSRSRKNADLLGGAQEAFEIALAACEAAHTACARAEAEDTAATAAAEAAERAAAEPNLF